jgi:hypothetical protein
VADRSAAEALSAAWETFERSLKDGSDWDDELASRFAYHRPLIEAALDRERAAALPDDDETEPCPTCWQPVPVPQRGDHDYGIPLRAAALPTQSVSVGVVMPSGHEHRLSHVTDFDADQTWDCGTAHIKVKDGDIVTVSLPGRRAAIAQEGSPVGLDEGEPEPCPTCWQPVPIPQRGDHDYGIPVADVRRTYPALIVKHVVRLRASLADAFCYLREHDHLTTERSCPASRGEAESVVVCLAALSDDVSPGVEPEPTETKKENR